jgi:benzoyl-CoA reductase subunit B
MTSKKLPLKSWDECKALTKDFYRNILQAKKEGKKLGWMGASMPAELMRVFDVVPVFGEPYGATVAFDADLARELLKASEQAGYARDLCAYSRNFIGSILTNKSHVGEFPHPDFIAEIRAGCSSHFKWWENAARLVDCPMFVMETPLLPRGVVEDYHIEYYLAMLERLIAFLEEVTGKKLNEERFIESVINTQRALALWDDILDYCKTVPSPLEFKSLLTLMTPSFLLRGSPEAVDFYKRLRDEIRERVEQGIGAVSPERKRLLWDNIPMWYNLSVFHQLDKVGAVIVASPYTSMWGTAYKTLGKNGEGSKAEKEPPAEPSTYPQALRTMAEYMVDSAVGLTYQVNQRIFKGMIEEYTIDGVICHSNRGCKGLSNGRLDIMQWLQEECQVPVLIFESNSADPDDFAEGQIRTRLEAFLEILFRE